MNPEAHGTLDMMAAAVAAAAVKHRALDMQRRKLRPPLVMVLLLSSFSILLRRFLRSVCLCPWMSILTVTHMMQVGRLCPQ